MANKMQQFTKGAQDVMRLAQKSSEDYKHNYIGTEHLLLGMLLERKGIAGRALRQLGIDETRVEELLQRMTRAEQRSEHAPVELSPGCKRVLELAVSEAQRRQDNLIDTKHLLLGLVGLPEGVAIDIFKRMGITPKAITYQIDIVSSDAIDFSKASSAPPLPPLPETTRTPRRMERFTQRARRVLSLAQEAAESFQHNYIGTEHLLLGLILEEGGVAGRVLRELGSDQRRVEELVERMTRASPRTTTIAPELSPGTKRVLELAVDEARRMGHHYIGTEHLLLGLVRLPEGVAIDILKRLGISPEEVRRQTRRVLQEAPFVPRKEETTENVHRVFIGCAKEDEKVAEWIIYGLAGQQLISWKNSVAVLGDGGWDDSLTLALLRSNILVLVLSPNGLADKHIAKERLFFEQILERPIIPVLWQDCEIDPELQKLGVIDMRGQREEGIAELVAAIQKHLATNT